MPAPAVAAPAVQPIGCLDAHGRLRLFERRAAVAVRVGALIDALARRPAGRARAPLAALAVQAEGRLDCMRRRLRRLGGVARLHLALDVCIAQRRCRADACHSHSCTHAATDAAVVVRAARALVRDAPAPALAGEWHIAPRATLGPPLVAFARRSHALARVVRRARAGGTAAAVLADELRGPAAGGVVLLVGVRLAPVVDDCGVRAVARHARRRVLAHAAKV
mmetsp:Transcript_13187/g.41223  ORF Transcript_13187/g.41223 Transcript_13187/m.41223 type:complete len:222 (+) Transcript_13187:467-1132(+)